jgi:hypothetical protein
LIRKIAWPRRVYNIKNNFKLKLKRRKMQVELNGSRWNLERWDFVVHQWQ